MAIAYYDESVTIKDIGNFIMEYEARQNAFITAAVNLIVRVIVTSKSWNSPLAWTMRGKLENGETIEELFVNIAKVFSYDPERAEEKWMQRVKPDVRSAFHTMNYQKYYKTTTQQYDFARMFFSWGAVNDFISRIVESLWTGMEYDNWIVTKYMMCRYALNGYMRVDTVPAGDTERDIKDMVKKVRSNSRRMTILSSAYNRAGVMNHSPYASQYLFVDADLEAALDVDVLAVAFNMDKTEFVGHWNVFDTFIPTADEEARLKQLFTSDETGELDPDFVAFTADDKSKLANLKGMVVDKDFFMVFQNFLASRAAENPEGVYWNHWLHVWMTYSISPFANAYALYSAQSGVTRVAVSPATANITQGSGMILTAEVTGNGLFPKDVMFEITGATLNDEAVELQSGTTIGAANGNLVVSRNEQVGTKITVTATAADGKTGTAVITVTEA